jgi:hypothetical protein
LSELFRLAEKKSIFVGDFNLPDIDWISGDTGSRTSGEVLAAANATGL